MVKSICIDKDCKKRASFNLPGNKPIYCKNHKLHTMINVVHKHCEYHNCYVRATFGNKLNKPTHCVKHKLESMSDVINKTCEVTDCNIQPMYGYVKNKATHCKQHKNDDMIDVKSKLCLYTDCTKQPSFNYSNEKTPTYCKEHSLPNMMDIRSNKCKHINCNKMPHFGPINGKPEYCFTHKLSDMINLIDKRCIYNNCIIQASYNYKGETKRLYCNEHKLDKMVCLSTRICIFDNCNIIATFNYNNMKADYCKQHAKDDMVNLTHKRCPGIYSSGCPYEHISMKKYDYYCTRCFLQKFPTDPRSALIYKNGDEIKVVQYLQKELPDHSFIHDKPIWIDNCECMHKRRVDLRLLINDTILAIEIDEKQHKGRNQEDETIRYDDLYMIYSGKWIFIRYNPHSYKNHIGKHKNTPSDTRLNTLVTLIKTKINEITNGTNTELIEIHKLYYDGWKDII